MPNTELSWQAARLPQGQTLTGRYVRLEKLDAARHGDDLWHVLEGPNADPLLWDYLPNGPFRPRSAFDAWLTKAATNADPFMYSIVDIASGQVQGMLALMSIVPDHGRIEIGHVMFSAAMQRSPKSTETIYLLAKESFDLGNRRLEWKCNNQNARSKSAALRLGFTYEGLFRQHMVTKGKSRDTAWYSILDSEWPALATAFQRWLAPENQTADGQIKGLVECRKVWVDEENAGL